MSDYETVEINVLKDRVYFRIEGSDYTGEPDFKAKSRTKLLSLRGADHKAYGLQLREMTFRQDAADGLAHLRRSIDQKRFYRVRLNIDPKAPDLHDLWWECLLTDPSRCMSRSSTTPLSRYLNLAKSREPFDQPKLRILLVIASPQDLGDPNGKWKDLPAIAEADEEQVIRESLSGMEDRIEELHVLTKPASLTRIWSLLRERNYNILHIIAHGGFDGNRGTLLLENSRDQTADPVDDSKLVELVQDFFSLQLVILAACHSAERSQANAFLGLAPRIVEAGVPAVVAMQDRVTQTAARSFTQEFYEALLRSEQTFGMVDGAINSARRKLWFDDNNSWEWAIPVLFMRGDGQLLSAKSTTYASHFSSYLSLPVTPSTGANIPIPAPVQPAGYSQSPIVAQQAGQATPGYSPRPEQIPSKGVEVKGTPSGQATDFSSPNR